MDRDRVRQRDREIRTSTNTPHEHEFTQSIERTLRQRSGHSAYGSFSAACLEEPFLLQLPHHPIVDDVFDLELANRLAGATEEANDVA